MKQILIALIAVVSANAFAATSNYKGYVTRNGVTTERTIYNFWSGEWPGPIINVNDGKKGSTTIQAVKSVRKENPAAVACTIKNGVYHPWAKNNVSVKDYYTLKSNWEFAANKDITIALEYGIDEPTNFKKGDKVNVIYGAENFCLATVNGKEVGFGCDEIVSNPDFTQISPDDDFYEQWLYVNCAEGYAAFVQDTALLAQKGVKTGDICEYGVVKEKGKCPPSIAP